MYSRACLSRTVTLVVALSLTAASTGAGAREFRAAGTGNPDHSNVAVALIRTCAQANHASADAALVSLHPMSCNNAGFKAAIAGIDAKAQLGPATARPIEPIRKLE